MLFLGRMNLVHPLLDFANFVMAGAFLLPFGTVTVADFAGEGDLDCAEMAV